MTPPASGDQNQGSTINAIIWSFVAVSLLTVVARLFGRIKLTCNVGWDDFWILISMAFNLIFACIASAAVAAGGGRHAYYIGLPAASKTIRLEFVADWFGIISVALPKLAVTCLYTRLFNLTPLHKWILYGLSISCIVTQTICAIILSTQCKPLQGLWDPLLKPKCWSPSVLIDFAIFAGSYSAFLDLAFAIYPATILFKLNMSKKRKICASCALSFGIFAAVAGIYKCTTLQGFRDVEDFTWSTGDLLILTAVEPAVIIIAACLPTLQPFYLLLTKQKEALKNSSQKKSSHSTDYQLHSVSKGSKGLGNQRPKDPYPTNTSMFGDDDGMEDRILPSQGIRRTYNVAVTHGARSVTDMPGDDLESRSAQWELPSRA